MAELSSYAEHLLAEEKTRYKAKISELGEDPYLLTGSYDIRQIPNVSFIDILQYLVLKKSAYTDEEFRAYKSIDAYKNCRSGFLKSLEVYRKLDFCVLLSQVLKKDGQLVKRAEFNEQLRQKRKHDFSDDSIEILEERLASDGPSTSISFSTSRWDGKERLSTPAFVSPAKRPRMSPPHLSSPVRTFSIDDDFERPNMKQQMEVEERIDLTEDGDYEEAFEDDMEMEELLREDDDDLLFESDEEIKVMLARDAPLFDSDDD